jgi:hypothetical protein
MQIILIITVHVASALRMDANPFVLWKQQSENSQWDEAKDSAIFYRKAIRGNVAQELEFIEAMLKQFGFTDGTQFLKEFEFKSDVDEAVQWWFKEERSLSDKQSKKIHAKNYTKEKVSEITPEDKAIILNLYAQYESIATKEEVAGHVEKMRENPKLREQVLDALLKWQSIESACRRYPENCTAAGKIFSEVAPDFERSEFFPSKMFAVEPLSYTNGDVTLKFYMPTSHFQATGVGHDYTHYIMKVERYENGSQKPVAKGYRWAYRSNSAGGFRVCPGMSDDDTYFAKGWDYASGTKAEWAINQAMENSVTATLKPKQWDMIRRVWGNARNIRFFELESVPSAFRDILAANSVLSADDIANVEKTLIRPKSETDKGLWIEPQFKEMEAAVRALQAINLFVPDVSTAPRTEPCTHTILGDFQCLFYTGNFGADSIQWVIGYQPPFSGNMPTHVSRTWVQKAWLSSESEMVSSHGLNPTNIGSLILNKPVEYKSNSAKHFDAYNSSVEKEQSIIKDGVSSGEVYVTANSVLQHHLPFLQTVAFDMDKKIMEERFNEIDADKQSEIRAVLNLTGDIKEYINAQFVGFTGAESHEKFHPLFELDKLIAQHEDPCKALDPEHQSHVMRFHPMYFLLKCTRARLNTVPASVERKLYKRTDWTKQDCWRAYIMKEIFGIKKSESAIYDPLKPQFKEELRIAQQAYNSRPNSPYFVASDKKVTRDTIAHVLDHYINMIDWFNDNNNTYLRKAVSEKFKDSKQKIDLSGDFETTIMRIEGSMKFQKFQVPEEDKACAHRLNLLEAIQTAYSQVRPANV